MVRTSTSPGRSSDLLFALALITSKWKTNGRYPAIAATGMLDADSATLSGEAASAVHGVEHTVEKLAAAVSSFVNEPEAVVSYPEADAESVTTWSASANVPAQLRLHPVKDLEDALSFLGICLEKMYLGNPFHGLEHFDYPRHWRYRRATLARLLAREGMMQQVADAYGSVQVSNSASKLFR